MLVFWGTVLLLWQEPFFEKDNPAHSVAAGFPHIGFDFSIRGRWHLKTP